MTDARCTIREVTLGRGVRGLRIENDLIATTILPEKGADVYELIDKRRGLDVLWKSPWGLPPGGQRQSAFNSEAAWLEVYEGGWQEIFPSGGGPCVYNGVELNFHGEASLAVWNDEVAEAAADAAEVRFWTRLRRSPFLLERTMRVEAGKPVLRLRERVTNRGGERMEFMWGHHPAYGAPFLGAACRIDTNARSVRADDGYAGTANPLARDGRYRWPTVERAGVTTDLSRVPGEETPRDTLAYLHDFAGDHGWYALTNTELGVGVGLVWPTAVFPYAWFWQEMHASSGFPWYRAVYVMAIEPFSSIPGQGLVKVIETTGSQLALDPGESLAVEVTAVLYESTTGVAGIEPDGAVRVREG